MGALVGEFDLQDPQTIWGLDGYPRIEVLFRRGGMPIGWLSIPLRHASVLTADELMEWAEDSGIIEFPLQPQQSAHSPFITVIVCTRDRPMILRRCLESLMSLRYENFEVLVVDNASRSSETKDVVAETPFRYLREETPGLDRARNCGLRAAQGEIVAYTDDDAKVDANWLNAIAIGFRDPMIACVTGLVAPMELRTKAQLLFEENGGMGKGRWPRVFDRSDVQHNAMIATQLCGVGANMAFRRQALTELGGFDVHLDVGTPSHGGGDLDIFHRTLASGKRIGYEPSALVWHQHRRAMPALHKQFYDNGRAFGCYLLKVASDRRVARTELAAFTVKNWIGGWMIGSVIKGRTGRRPMLVAAEILGALSSPWAYWKTYRRLPLVTPVS